MITKSISLQLTNAESDKVYHLQIISSHDGTYMVQSQYGKRGKNLRWFALTPEPVLKWTAEKVFNDKVAKEKAKGYWEIPVPIELITEIALSL